MNKEKQRQQIHRLLDVVLDCNGLEERKQYRTGNLPTMFFRFSGHVAAVTMELHKNGWKQGEAEDRHWWINLTNDITDGEVEAVREAAEAALKKGE